MKCFHRIYFSFSVKDMAAVRITIWLMDIVKVAEIRFMYNFKNYLRKKTKCSLC